MNALRRRLVLGGPMAVLSRPSTAQAHSAVVTAGGGRIELQFDEGFDAPVRAAAQRWAERAALAVSDYLGRFPLAEVELLLIRSTGAGVRGGTTFGEPAPYIRIRLGTETTPAQFDADWILVHEMLHLAVPRVPRAQSWLHEGIATYVEGIVRARAGLIDAQRMWLGLARGLPQGLPADGDRGLDHTPTWGRTYWGGALFCLQAELLVHERSGGRLGLRHALQGVLAASGSYAVAWPAARILAVADAAIGQTTLSELRALHGAKSTATDLGALLARLGIDVQRGRLDEHGPATALRRAITG